MASRFWIGGTGSWDQATTTHWSTTSGGAGGASVPTIADDTIFDASSGGGTVTVTATAPCLSFNAAAFTGNFTFSAGLTVTGGGNVALPTAGVTTSGSFGITMSGGAASTITFNSSKIGSGLAIGNLASTDKVTIQDTCQIGGTVTLNAGTLDANGQTCTWNTFNSNFSRTRAMTIGTSNITLTGANTVWDVTTSTGMTQTASVGSTVTSTGANAVIRGNNANDANVQFYNVTMTGSGQAGLFYCKVNNNFTRTGTAVKTDGVSFTEVTVGGTFALTGNSATNRLLVNTAHAAPIAAIVTAAAVSLANVDFQDIQAAGAAIPWTGTSLGDLGGNSNITFDTPTTQTWSGNTTGNWSNPANWTSRVPLPQDNAVITSLTSGTVSVDMPRLGSVDFTGSTVGHVTFLTAISIYGSWTYVSTLVVGGNFPFTFSGRGSYTLTCAGIGPATSSTLNAPGGTMTQLDNFLMQNAAAQLNITVGTWVVNGFNMRSVLYSIGGVAIFNMGSGTITATNAGTVFTNVSGTMIPGTSTFVVSDTSSATKTFTGGGKTFNNLTITGGTGAVVVTGANTFNALAVAAGTPLVLPASTTTSVTSLSASGNPVSNPGYLSLPGIAGQSASTPSSTPLNITGALTIEAKLAPATWLATSAVMGRWGGGSPLNFYLLRISATGGLLFTASADGATSTINTGSTANTGFAAGSTHWVRVTFTPNSATGLRYWTSPDGTTWTQLGSSITTVSIASIFSGSQQVELGVYQNGTNSPFAGSYYRCTIYNSDLGSGAGTPVFDADFSGVTAGATSFTESSANAATVTLTGAAAQAWGRTPIISSTPGTAATLKSTNIISTDYVTVQDSTASGCIPFYAGANGTLVSGDTNWSAIANPNPTNQGATLGLVGVG